MPCAQGVIQPTSGTVQGTVGPTLPLAAGAPPLATLTRDSQVSVVRWWTDSDAADERLPRSLVWALALAVWAMPLAAELLFPWYKEVAAPPTYRDTLRPLALVVAPCCLWAGFTPAILGLQRRLRWTTRHSRWPVVGVAQIGLAVVVLLLEGAAGFGYLALVHPLYWTGRFLPLGLGFFRGSVVVLAPVYVICALVEHGVQLQRHARQRELREATLATQLAQAQLGALRMQLNPHFLFNSLNAVAGMVREQDTNGAVRAIALLSGLLRGLLDGTRKDEVTLRAELEFVGQYLELERVRFSDRLRVEVEVGDDAWDALVPNLLLQPLVENAIRHGIARRAAAGRLRIAATRSESTLVVEVKDDGPGLSATSSSTGTGVGLANTRQRLEQLYGGRGILTVRNSPGGGVVVRVVVPFHLSPENRA